ncbi:hypothetical protein TVAG_345490 [Trichomonas vaginalis G3]|uniref:Uncharacterized protein n=1 Tax=Trichomonas vaginalis (strain ATCC PRA-98 / G3) TaxID=412133 RepID=A2EW27_TRIV3|nr:hypothetical protein TVAGG3_0120830 [Trichomonas vaginalis G3]EAY03175.1 hypothetical protein TVAG_345490 [Trichomonas vaginalis G3]KAI5545463.1 hypothetical protein TVAGG3_0120830 [Trichomonas vaginalis G3]|eukprot:XP_001315398.1 hypothetical protein [Trichomonas vaginalis G3]
MSTEESDFTNSTSPGSFKSVYENDVKASQEKEAVQELELKKKRYELKIKQLEADISNANAESFSRDQLPSVKSELEKSCNQLFLQRTNALTLKLEQAKAERLNLEKQVKSLQKTLENERRLTKQLADERESHKPPRPPPFPEITLPDLSLLRDNYALIYRKRALEEEIRDAERQLSVRRQAIAENEGKLTKLIKDSKEATAQSEAQIRQETLDLAQLEEMRNSLRERLESNKQRQKQLENEKRMLAAQIEAAEAEQRAKIDEINRNFLAAQREFDEARARKKAEIRELTKKLHENEELNRAKIQEKERLILEMNAAIEKRNIEKRQREEEKRKQQQRKRMEQRQKNGSPQSGPTPAVLQLQQEIADLENQKAELMRKSQDLIRKMTSNEKKLEATKAKIERKLAESERQLKRMKAERASPGSQSTPIKNTLVADDFVE